MAPNLARQPRREGILSLMPETSRTAKAHRRSDAYDNSDMPSIIKQILSNTQTIISLHLTYLSRTPLPPEGRVAFFRP